MMTQYEVIYNVRLPIACDKRKGARNGRIKTSKISTTYTLVEGEERLDITTTVNNVWNDHRLRALFPSGLITIEHHAHSQYDVIKRDNKPWAGWKNPSNCLKQRYFVDNSTKSEGLMIANKGLMEYEIVSNHMIALTLLRSIGELGDWGEFPTPGAQCIGENVANYSIIPHIGDLQNSMAFNKAYEFNVHLMASQSMSCAKNLSMPFAFSTGQYIVTAIKKCESRDSIIVRFYNIAETNSETTLKVDESVAEVYQTNLNEDRISKLVIDKHKVFIKTNKKEIITLEIVIKEKNNIKSK